LARKADTPAVSASPNGKPRVVASFFYDDGDGNQIARVDRVEPGRNGKRKEFFPYLRDGDGWAKKSDLGGRTLPLYHRGEVLEAARTGKMIFKVEGEGKADKLRDAFRAAGIEAAVTTIAGGANAKLLDEHVTDFACAPMVVVLPDADETGRQAATERAGRIARVHPVVDVRIVELYPGVDDKRDVANWIDEGRDVRELLTLPDAAPRVEPPADDEKLAQEVERAAGLDDVAYDHERLAIAKRLGIRAETLDGLRKERQRGVRAAAHAAGDDGKDSRGPSIATKIVTLVLEEAELLHDGDDACASVMVNRHRETHRVLSTSFRRYAVRAYYEAYGAAPNGTALAEALATLDAKARFDGAPCTIATRCAEHDGKLYLDLTNDDWTLIEISGDGWTLVPAADAPVRFVRTRTAQPLPMPNPAGRLDEIDAFVPGDDRDRTILKGFLLNALRARTPQPILTIIGPPGSGKTTIARVCKRIVDPAKPETRGEPHEDRDVTAAARNSHVLVFDNFSKIEPDLSDIFCRLSTGSGFGGRLLYTNDDEAAFDAIRPIILTAIEHVVVRGDLADRALTMRPPERDDETSGYRTEDALFDAFERARANILGGLLNVASFALARLPAIRAQVDSGKIKLPRLADFALFITAAEPALGLVDGDFIRLLREERATASCAVLEADVIYATLCAAIAEEPFTGYPADLLVTLTARAPETVRRDRRWPTSPQKLTNRLKRLAPDLRRAGVDVVRHEPDGHTKRLRLTVTQRPPSSPAATEVAGKSSQSPQSPHFEHETASIPPHKSPQNALKSPQVDPKSPQAEPPPEHETGPFAETADTAETPSLYSPVAVAAHATRKTDGRSSLFAAAPVDGEREI
jgi:energy-coupling factor transporter ATP-binding protein EcfA2